jgi:cytochrome b6-f complex iron-sulfur subunit
LQKNVIRFAGDAALSMGTSRRAIRRRQLLRIGFVASTVLATSELLGVLPIFARVLKIEGLGGKVVAGKKADVLAAFARTNDEPILVTQGRFFLIHGPGAIAAAYRKCAHLGCAVPYAASEGRFHCPCHGSLYDKLTALMVRGPAPRGLDLFHVSEVNGAIVVDTNPLTAMHRDNNLWHPEQVEVMDV